MKSKILLISDGGCACTIPLHLNIFLHALLALARPPGQTKMLLDGATCTLHTWHMAGTFHMQIQLAYQMQSNTLAELGNLAGSVGDILMLLKHPHSGISVKCGSLFTLWQHQVSKSKAEPLPLVEN